MSRDPTTRSGAQRDGSAGQAWALFADAVRDLPEILQRPDTPLSELDVAEAYRHFGRLVTLALQNYVHHADANFPSFRRLGPETKFGGENPDVLYQSATLDGNGSYRITGTRGSCLYLEFTVASGFAGMDKPPRVISRMLSDELEVDDSGRFELVLSAAPVEGNWLRLEPDADALMVRHIFNDWETEEAATLRIVRIGNEGALRPVLKTQDAALGLESAARFVTSQARVWIEYVDTCRKKQPPNTFEPPPPPSSGLLGSQSFFSLGYFDLKDEEALVIEIPASTEGYLGLQLTNFWWFESLEYANRITSLNGHQSHVSSDGSIRYVVAHRDPGVPNWLDTEGHREGIMIFRWALVDSAPTPQTRVVRFDEIRSALPSDTPEVSAATRREEIRRRGAHVSRRFAI
ncbi:MAG: hypothetical protein JRH16_12850 [Deltaproteobacteria bacterium]|nr:hypothetical protein [Deltaproteobacteria bacterium]MBW2361009.1 hypothetical protein [Deltaproteobacteria bacterium]